VSWVGETARWDGGGAVRPGGRLICLARPNSESNFGNRWVEPKQLVYLGSTVGLAFLHFCVRADTNELGLSVWVAPLEMPLEHR
jgi:hypothetical protein